MKIRRYVNNLLIIFSIFAPSSCLAEVEDLAKQILEAQSHAAPMPNLAQDSGIDISKAYQIQAALVKEQLAEDKIIGFKAGLTSNSAQIRLGVNRPVFGVLLESGDRSQNPTISLKDYHYLIVETELGFITNRAIKHSVKSIPELKSYISQIVPVIELPNVGFAVQNFSASDLIAANAGTAAHIVYKGINWIDQDINLVTVSLLHNGVIVNQAQASDAMGDQWEALRWLVNQVLAHGWNIDKGSLLITGALGEMVPAQPGVFQAHFNDEASIEFTITR